MQTKLTQSFVDKAVAAKGMEREIFWDQRTPGFGLMVTAKGARSFVVQYRAGRLSRRMKLSCDLSLDEARKEAQKLRGDIARGSDPLADKRQKELDATNSFKTIAEAYLKREGKNQRSIDQQRRVLARVVFGRLGHRQIDQIKRSEIVTLLDEIDDERGPVMADRALSMIRKIMNWHARRSDKFVPPIVPGMARTSATERARSRILTDDELRAFWKAADESNSAFARHIQFTLLTATRRNESACMTRNELQGALWTIPASRYKTKRDTTLPLSAKAQALLDSIPVIGEYVFTTDGIHPIAGFAKFKVVFDKRCGVTGWRIHDLRRTARSLLSRAGVSADVAERCLGHAISGVRGVYDRHKYIEEMQQAFEALAQQLDRILNPTDNVVPLHGAA
jgi:integrase